MIGERKERSDKKRAVSPYISAAAYEQVARIGYVCDLPLKSVGELLAREALQFKDLLEVIKRNIRRDFIVDDYQYCLGQATNKPFRMEFGEGKRRLAMRFYSFEYERYAALAYAMDCSLQMAIGFVIETALAKKSVMLSVLSKGIIRELEPKRKEQLRHICRYLNHRSHETYITLTMVLEHVLDQGISSQKKMIKTIDGWL